MEGLHACYHKLISLLSIPDPSRPLNVSNSSHWRCVATASFSSSSSTQVGVKREATWSIKRNPPRRVGKKVVKNKEESIGSEDLGYGGAVSVLALEPREEYAAFLESGARFKDWRNGGKGRNEGAPSMGGRKSWRRHQIKCQDEHQIRHCH